MYVSLSMLVLGITNISCWIDMLVSLRTGIVQITSMDVSLFMLFWGKTNIACWFGYAGFYENEHRSNNQHVCQFVLVGFWEN